jgi:hypothetical protein
VGEGSGRPTSREDEIASCPFAGRLLRGAMETAWSSDHLVHTVGSRGDPAKEDAAVAELLTASTRTAGPPASSAATTGSPEFTV